MEQVVVPQFLDIEDKIIGPVSVRQFIEMIVGGALIFICYKLFDFSLFLVTAFFIGVVTLIVAFVKINGQMFHNFILNFVVTFRRPSLKVWRRDISSNKMIQDSEVKKETIANYASLVQPPVRSSISELSLIVDTGGVYKGEK